MRKKFFFSISFFNILSGCQRNQNMAPQYQKDIKSKIAVGLGGHRTRAEKEFDRPISHCKVEQTANKAASTVVHKKLHGGIHIQRT